jgi:hypothetical protein
MTRWLVDYLGKPAEHLGTVSAKTEQEAVGEAAKRFEIAPSRRVKIVVQKISERDGK